MGRPRRFDQTAVALRRDIERGRFQGMSVLPGERQLAILMKVSRTTLRRAMADLTAEGLLSQRHGLGTIINARSDPPIDIPVSVPVVYYSLNGRVDDAVEVSRGIFGADMDEVMTFGIDPRDEVFRLSRVTFVRGGPDAIEHASAPLRLLPDASRIAASLPAALAAAGVRPIKKLQRLRPGILSGADAAHLGARPDDAAISLHEACYMADGACCSFTRAIYLAAKFDAVFSTRLAVEAEGTSGLIEGR